jgi:hypothetical protein
MKIAKYPVCGRVLVTNVSQIRADDEAATLVQWYPVHGTHYDLYRCYMDMSSRVPYNVHSNPSRSTHDLTYVPTRQPTEPIDGIIEV